MRGQFTRPHPFLSPEALRVWGWGSDCPHSPLSSDLLHLRYGQCFWLSGNGVGGQHSGWCTLSVRCSVNVYGFSSMRLSLSLPDSVPHPRPNPSRFCLGSSPGLAGYFWKSSGSCKHCGVQACYFHPIVDRLLYGLPRDGRWFHPSSSGSLNGRVIPFVICPIDFFSPPTRRRLTSCHLLREHRS